MDDLLQKLVEWLESASPQLWAILLKQVQVNAVTNGIVCIICAGLVVGVRMWLNVSWKAWRNDETYDVWPDDEMLKIFEFLYLVMTGLCFLVVAANVISIVGAILNPEYQAIQLILAQLKGN
jgi:uncharacterized membrane-anchored protein